MTAAGIYTAILGLIKAIPIVDGWFQQLVFYWVQGQKDAVRSAISDTLALAARAETDEQRYALSGKWQEIFKKPRVST